MSPLIVTPDQQEEDSRLMRGSGGCWRALPDSDARIRHAIGVRRRQSAGANPQIRHQPPLASLERQPAEALTTGERERKKERGNNREGKREREKRARARKREFGAEDFSSRSAGDQQRLDKPRRPHNLVPMPWARTCVEPDHAVGPGTVIVAG
jgi:hypothetical protein